MHAFGAHHWPMRICPVATSTAHAPITICSSPLPPLPSLTSAVSIPPTAAPAPPSAAAGADGAAGASASVRKKDASGCVDSISASVIVPRVTTATMSRLTTFTCKTHVKLEPYSHSERRSGAD